MRTLFRRRDGAARQALDLYDIAYLAGGPRRVAQVALITLRERGAIKFIGLRLRAVRPAEAADHPVERALIGWCHPVGCDAASAVAEVLSGPEVKRIGARLVSYGLLSRSRRRRTDAGGRALESAQQEGTLPAHVLQGLSAVPDERLRTAVGKAVPIPAGLGGTLIRMGHAFEDDDGDDYGQDAHGGSDSAPGPDWGSHSGSGHASCGSGCGGGGGGD
ncbi:TIGR04222 domain-containing membrane protein [Streptomyces cuspidosporus]|uniref:TIGR04222 domain-containing membrane protein n=1 Tax=Streptomyces cuspidosporus TaxID=66882 RepID=A0ABN3GG28_9ACTN